MVRHVLRETNHDADRIVKMIPTDLEGIDVLAEAPIDITEECFRLCHYSLNF